MTDAMGMSFCAGCESAILDRFLLKVIDKTWHVDCLRCFDCGVAMETKCFSRDGKLFCKDDFFRNYGVQCSGCSRGISPRDLVRRTRNGVYHVTCFTCAICRREPATGEQLFILDDKLFLCRKDYFARILHQTSSSTHSSRMEAGASANHRTTEVESVMAFNNSVDDSLENNTASAESSAFSSDSFQNCLSPSSDFLLLHNLPPNAKTQQQLPDSNVFRGCDVTSAHAQRVISRSLQQTRPVYCSERKEEGADVTVVCGLKNFRRPSEKLTKRETVDGAADGESAGTAAVAGTKKRGPRTTIKAKQLETLKAAFLHSPKPTRHVREKLASETSLSMRVIQVWFQNHRSKERRMRQITGSTSHNSSRRPPFYGGQRRPSSSASDVMRMTSSAWGSNARKTERKTEGNQRRHPLTHYLEDDDRSCLLTAVGNRSDSAAESLSSSSSPSLSFSSEVHPLINHHSAASLFSPSEVQAVISPNAAPPPHVTPQYTVNIF